MYQIIKPTPDDFDELTCLWEASVRATHHFIPEAYIQKLKPLVWSVYLHSMPLYMIRDNAGIEGFMGHRYGNRETIDALCFGALPCTLCRCKRTK